MINDPLAVIQGKNGTGERSAAPHTTLRAGSIAVVGKLEDQLSWYPASDECSQIPKQGA